MKTPTNYMKGDVCNRIESGGIKVECLHTKSMIANYLTKPLVGELFYKLRDLLPCYTTL